MDQALAWRNDPPAEPVRVTKNAPLQPALNGAEVKDTSAFSGRYGRDYFQILRVDIYDMVRNNGRTC